MAPPLTSNDEIIAALQEKAKSDPGGDRWRVKVFRRKAAATFPIHVATLDGATVEHIANAEMWLPMLCGGGPHFTVECFHVSNPSIWVGGKMTFHIEGEPRDVDLAAVKSQHWRGPETIIYPVPQSTQTHQPVYGTSASPTGTTGAPPMHGNTVQVPVGSQSGASSAQRELDALRAEIAAMKARTEREEIERRHREEMDKLRAEIRASQSVKPASDIGATIASAIAALGGMLMPIVQKTMEQGHEMRIKTMELQAQQATDQRTMLSEMAKKPQTDPVIEKVLDKMDRLVERVTEKKDDGSHVVAMTDAYAKMTKMTASTIGMLMDTMRPSDGPEPPALAVMKEVRGAIEAFADGMKANAAVKNKVNQGPSGAQPAGPQTYAPPGTQPQQLPAPATPLLDAIETQIRRHEDPDEIAKRFLDNIETDEIRTAIQAVDGNVIALFEQRLGNWLTENGTNGEYGTRLAKALVDEGQRRGLYGNAPPPGEAEEEAEETEA